MTLQELEEKALPCPFCGKKIEVYEIGNASKPTRGIEFHCALCSVSMIAKMHNRNPILTYEQFQKICLSNWNKRNGSEK